MFEKKFLAYVLYVTLLEIRENAYKNKDSRLFHLADMMHNIPFSLLNEESSRFQYDLMLKTVESLKIPEWLEQRMTEFKSRFPEFD